MFDTYAQKSNNLQVWNEELSPSRRYVILRVDELDKIARVKVVNGEELAQLDTTGTLTQKYQARLIPGESGEVAAGKATASFKSESIAFPCFWGTDQRSLAGPRGFRCCFLSVSRGDAVGAASPYFFNVLSIVLLSGRETDIGPLGLAGVRW